MRLEAAAAERIGGGYAFDIRSTGPFLIDLSDGGRPVRRPDRRNRRGREFLRPIP